MHSVSSATGGQKNDSISNSTNIDLEAQSSTLVTSTIAQTLFMLTINQINPLLLYAFQGKPPPSKSWFLDHTTVLWSLQTRTLPQEEHTNIPADN